MRRLSWSISAAIALGLAACAQQPPAAAPTAQTGSQQVPPPQGGVTFSAGQGPGQVNPPPVSAYTGSQRGSNSPLGATFQAPTNVPPTAYTGSQRGYSNSPLRFQRNPSGSSTPVETPPSSQTPPTQTQ